MQDFKTINQIGLVIFFSILPQLAIAQNESEPLSRPSIAVMQIETSHINEEDGATLSEVLTTELSALDRFSVISARDVQAILEHKANQQALGCEDESCFAALGDILGTDYLLITQISYLAEQYIINIKLANIKRAKVIRRVYEKVSGAQEDLLEALRYSLRAVTDSDAEEGVVRGRPLISTTPLILSGVALVATSIGIGFGLKARRHHGHANDPNYAGGQLEISSGKTAQHIANISFVAAALSIISSAALYVLWDTDWLESTTILNPHIENNEQGEISASLSLTF